MSSPLPKNFKAQKKQRHNLLSKTSFNYLHPHQTHHVNKLITAPTPHQGGLLIYSQKDYNIDREKIVQYFRHMNQTKITHKIILASTIILITLYTIKWLMLKLA